MAKKRDMAKKKFEDLPGWVRALMGLGGTADVVLRIAAMIDVARRDKDEVNGPKAVWLPALGAVSSMGLLPLAYFRWGRRGPAK
ncbi:hypothetical protein [Tessaracoccus sp. ZS01]|uniref:hypothetical protein n=1 Tax=Tessaracoccus sp. ZS01 TaxID=1906324 RepID=UPI00117F3BCB|nr:hypothetical protein [Tessaracoccus sp. ZS01]MCG6567631.1 hypothetical protein [Tessaracoccus sp. ZS01]